MIANMNESRNYRKYFEIKGNVWRRWLKSKMPPVARHAKPFLFFSDAIRRTAKATRRSSLCVSVRWSVTYSVGLWACGNFKTWLRYSTLHFCCLELARCSQTADPDETRDELENYYSTLHSLDSFTYVVCRGAYTSKSVSGDKPCNA